MFNKDSMLVQTWMRLIQSGAYTKEDVPNLFNLREVVAAALPADE